MAMNSINLKMSYARASYIIGSDEVESAGFEPATTML